MVQISKEPDTGWGMEGGGESSEAEGPESSLSAVE